MLSFLNPALAYGAAAIAIPIIIYFLQRFKVKEVEWAAMQFLLDILEEQKRRITWEEILLLILRCLMMLFLAMAVARPIMISGMIGALMGGSADAIIMIDASYSMQTREGAQSRWEEAKERAVAILDQMPSTYGVSLILASESPDPIISSFETNHELVRETIRNLKPTALAGNPATSLAEAELVFDAGKQPDRFLYYVSDFQRRDWETPDASLRKSLESLSKKSKVALIWVGDGATANCTATELTLTRGAARTGVKAQFSGKIFNHGETTANNVPVDLLVDGQVSESVTVSVAPGQGTPVMFNPLIQIDGPHRATLRIRSDSLEEDNSCYYAFNASGPLKVLAIVDSAPMAGEASPDTDFIELALSPYREGSENPNALYRLQVMSATDMGAESLDEFELVMISNATGFTGVEADIFQDYVRGGGGLLMFLGKNTHPNSYNAGMHRGGEGLLPWALLPDSLQNADAEAPLGFSALHPTHPVWGVLTGGEQDYLQSLRIYRSFGFEKGKEDRVIVLGEARTETSEKAVPVMLDCAYGRGHVIAVGWSADTEMSNFPVRTAFVSFVNQAASYLRSFKIGLSSLKAGTQVEIPVDFRHSQATFRLVYPSKDEQGISVLGEDGDFTLTLPPLLENGFYTLSNQNDAADVRHLAVNPDPAEGAISCVASGELAKLYSGDGLEELVIHDNPSMEGLFEGSAGASDFSFLMLILLLLCWLGENLLAYRIDMR